MNGIAQEFGAPSGASRHTPRAARGSGALRRALSGLQRSRFPMRLLRLLILLPSLLAGPLHAADLLVFAAASMKPALDEIVALPQARAIGTITTSYGASSALARQIDAGATADLFISADEEWMDWLSQRKRVAEATRAVLARNELVLVAPRDSTLAVSLDTRTDLRSALGDSRIALAEPGSVPAGKYAKAALGKLGLWTQVETRYVATENVRAALALALRGEVPLAVVYRSDAVSEPGVRLVAAFPSDSHPAIVYPVAALYGHDDAEAQHLLALLQGEAAQTILRRWGFRAPRAE